jgi:hypothetical protein
MKALKQMSSAFSRTRCDHTVCLLEQNNELVVQRGRYVSETIAPLSDDPIVRLAAVATA